MTKFWESAASSLASRLMSSSGPALVFWVWAALVWAIGKGAGWDSFHATMTSLFNDAQAPSLLAGAVAGLILVTVSSLIIDCFTLRILRLLEGYWPTWPGIALVARRRRERWRGKLLCLEQSLLEASDAGDQVAGARIQTELRNYPPDEADMLPTRVGNIIRAGERRPYIWYGLDPVIVWPQLWLVLPEQPRIDLTYSRGQLDRSVAACTWAVLSCALAALWPWAALTGVLAAAAIWYWWLPAAAWRYATLISAIFDTHRFLLYNALHYPLPTDPRTEPESGRALTQALWTDNNKSPAYIHPIQK